MLGEAEIKSNWSLRSFSLMPPTSTARQEVLDLAVSGGGSAAADPSLSGSYLFPCSGGGSSKSLGYCNPALGYDLFAKAWRCRYRGAQANFYQTAKILNDEGAYIGLISRTHFLCLINKRLTGIKPASSFG